MLHDSVQLVIYHRDKAVDTVYLNYGNIINDDNNNTTTNRHYLTIIILVYGQIYFLKHQILPMFCLGCANW